MGRLDEVDLSFVVFEDWDALGKGGSTKRLVAPSIRATSASPSSPRLPMTRI
jgi:hypothetical protein